jgi:chemotaxis protein MotB
LSGGPGTGKTELARQAARASGRDLIMFNVAEQRDKYFGESEKRIKEVFDSYENMIQSGYRPPVLFFNEADSVFQKRSSNESSMSKTEQLNIALKEKGDLLQIREKKLAELEAIIKRQDSLTNALSDIVKKALLSFNSDELTVEMKNGKVYVSLSDKLLFKSGSADVEEKGLDAIKKLAEVLNKNMEIDVLVEGHTDNKPIKTAVFADNWDLSTARANNIVRLLSSNYAVEPKRLTAAGRGEYQPKANNEIAEGRAKNRRTEIILSPKLDELYKIINKKR